ncbi:spermine/spermidine synthase domain-containing protein [Lysobacter tyrosinilyticus]
MPPRRALTLAIALVSAGALAYQLLLMRWLAIAHWHPFAVMIISLALLGHGASGTWLGLWLPSARRHFDHWFPAAALLFALSAVVVLELARRVPFNGLELVWNPRQLLWLSALYLLLALPFFFAASCFGLAFVQRGDDIPQLYGADLLGAGAGAVLAVTLLWLPVERAVVLAAACGVLAAAAIAPRSAVHALALVLTTGLLTALLATRALAPAVNEYKGLAKNLLLPGARVVAERHGPYGWLTVVDSPRVPLRHAPGLSLANTQEPPPQLGVYTDGDALAVITRKRQADSLAYLGQMTSALPYRLRQQPRVLVLGGGGGADVLQALTLGARTVDVVEVDPQRLQLVRESFNDYAGHLYRDPRVRLTEAEPRAFARAKARQYDLVVLGSGESFAGGGAGVQASSEQYALTVEALSDYLQLLAPYGLLAITRYSKQPPRDELKLWATAIAAMRASGRGDPQRRMVGIRSWDASTLLIEKGRFSGDEIVQVRAFADANSFDPVYAPGLSAADANHYNVVEHPYLYQGVQALLSQRGAAFVRDYKFAIAPATDDRPYFGNFFRWRSLPELWRLRAQGGAVLLDSGYLLLLGGLAQAVPITLVLVLLPLLKRRSATTPKPAHRLRIAGYFIALGLAFLMIEIATLSRLTLLVGHPLLAAATGLAGFLTCAGAGSLFAQRVLRWILMHVPAAKLEVAIARRVRMAVFAIALGLLWQFEVFAAAFERGASWPVGARAAAGLLGLAPLAFAMGLPFPLGLARLARTQPDFVPWAWGLNGCASVIAAMAALLLAMAVGLHTTLLLALGLYVGAAWVWRAPERRQTDTAL